MTGVYQEDPTTGRQFAVNTLDATPEEAAEDVAYSPFTGEPLAPVEDTGDDHEAESDDAGDEEE